MQDPWGELNSIGASAKSQVAKAQVSPKVFVVTAGKAATLPSAAKDDPSVSAPVLDPECTGMPPLAYDESDDDEREWARGVDARASAGKRESQQSAARGQATKARAQDAPKAVSAATPKSPALPSAGKRESYVSAPGLDPDYADMPPLTRDESDDDMPSVHSPAQAANAKRELLAKANRVAALPVIPAEEQPSVTLPVTPTSKLLPTSYSIPVPTSALAQPRDAVFTTRRSPTASSS